MDGMPLWKYVGVARLFSYQPNDKTGHPSNYCGAGNS